MTILITGATGFVGQRVCNMLLQENQKIRVISRNPSSFFDDLVEVDLALDDVEKNIFDDVTAVFHMAGYAHDLRSTVDSGVYYRLNVEATKNLAQTASDCGVSSFIYISSTKAGESDDQGFALNSGQGIYGKTKRDAELEILSIASRSQMRVNIIRPALIYGPNVKGNLQSMLQGIRAGWFPPLPEVYNKRSMVHVDDVARSITHINNKLSLNKQIYNLTDNQEYSSSEIYDILCLVLGKRIKKLRCPMILFTILSLIHPSIKYKVNKLLGSETFSCSKIISSGFQPEKTLKNINESNY